MLTSSTRGDVNLDFRRPVAHDGLILIPTAVAVRGAVGPRLDAATRRTIRSRPSTDRAATLFQGPAERRLTGLQRTSGATSTVQKWGFMNDS